MKNGFAIIVGTFALMGVIAAGVLYIYWDQAVPIVGMAVNYVRYRSAPAGTLVTQVATPSRSASIAQASNPSQTLPQNAVVGDWPSYNKTLTSDRYAGLAQINTQNAGKLKVLCTYDTDQYTGFTTGLIEVEQDRATSREVVACD